jgi:hypothetical protein
MKISHLTFGQLYKLAHPWNFMRLEAARYAAMNRARAALGTEVAPPHVAARYNKVMDFLRGPELKAALKAAAAEQDIPYVPGAALELCRFRWSQLAYAHANIVYTFCKLYGAVAQVLVEGSDVVVRVDTTPLGIAAMNYHPGLKWKTICQECAIENLRSPLDIFWWLSPIAPLGENERLNPAVWPCNTPDVAAIAESLVTRAS